MGCCLSTPSNAAHPYDNAPQRRPNSPERAIAHPQPESQAALRRPSTHASSHSNNNRPQQNQNPLAAHINNPLVLHTVWKKVPTRIWTRKELDKERIDFFETRVTGQEEVWQTLHTVLQILWNGGDEGDTDGGLATAQTILDAVGITLPSGDLADKVYDNLGALYPLPEYIVADPPNMQELPASEDDEDKSEEEDKDEILRRREEKGKAVMNAKDLVVIRAKLSDREQMPLKVTISKSDSVRLVGRKILEEANLSSTLPTNIFYMGKRLKDNENLESQGWELGMALNLFIFDEAATK